jgi:hypothetical protein
MQYQTESKFQNWRALAVFDDGSECLLYVGRSTTQVRAGYEAAFADMLEPAERDRITRVVLQCWQGAADQGCWQTKDVLRVPTDKSRTVDAAKASLLPFRRPTAAVEATDDIDEAVAV